MLSPPALALPPWQVAAAVLTLAPSRPAAIRGRRQRPYLLVGWLWYVGMLAPVIGLVQFGAQAEADRFTYLPQIGLAMAVVWTAMGVKGEREAGEPGDKETRRRANRGWRPESPCLRVSCLLVSSAPSPPPWAWRRCRRRVASDLLLARQRDTLEPRIGLPSAEHRGP